MNRYSPYYDHDAERVEMSLDERGSWVHINSVDAIAVKALQRENAALREALKKARPFVDLSARLSPDPFTRLMASQCRSSLDAALTPSAAPGEGETR